MIKTKLMDHQKLVTDFAEEKEYVGIFAGYGSGKTLCALEIIQRNGWKLNIVVSSKTAITSTWPDEIEKHSDFRYALLTGHRKQKLKTLQMALDRTAVRESSIYKSSRKTLILLINFDGVRNIYEELIRLKPNSIFIDESTKIKSTRALRTKVLWALGKKCDQRFIMTGWPTTESLFEIYAQIKFLDMGKTFGNSFIRFRQNYFFPQGFKWVPKKNAAKKIFDAIKPFCIRVSEDVIKLPPKVYIKEALQPSKQQKELLDKFKSHFMVEFGKVNISTEQIFVLLNKSLQICDGFISDKWCTRIGDVDTEDGVICSACGKPFPKEMFNKSKCPRCGHTGNMEVLDTSKDEALLDIMEQIGNEKVLIWANFRMSVKKISRLLTKLGHNVLTLTGATEDPGKVVRLFQHTSKYDVLIATQKKASESITLTNCRRAIYYSNNWSYDLRGNSEARIRRKGSEKHDSIIYTDMYLKGTVEQVVYDSLRSKANMVTNLKKFFKEIK